MLCKLPYHKGYIDANIDDKNILAVLQSEIHSYKAEKSQEETVEDALRAPIQSLPLRELAKNKKSVLVVTNDHTRAMPSKITLPILLKEIRAENPGIDVKIMIATGLHRQTTNEELLNMLGKDIVENEKICIHNAFDDSAMADLGKLPSGNDLYVNKMVVEAELLVCEGFIEPHFFAGFSGGRKSVFPGTASAKSVNQNHSYLAIANKNATTGVLLNNPVHEDMMYAVKKVGVDFILNITLDQEKRIIAAFAGDIEQAHKQGCEFVFNLSKVKSIEADIVITTNGGYPLDQNLYQCPKGISAAAMCAKPGGVIIMAAGCIDGLGGENFGRIMLMKDPQKILDYLGGIPADKTISEQWCNQIFARILLKNKVILLTTYIDRETITNMGLIPAETFDEALETAFQMQGRDASIVVIPDGATTIVHKEE